MPTITAVARPQQSQNPDNYRSPVKTIQAASTGMQIRNPALQPVENTDQPVIGKAAVTTTPKSGAETVQLTPQLTELARKEQKFRQEQQAFKEKQAALDAKAAKLAKFEALEQKLAAKDYSAMEELGVSYNEYVQYLINREAATTPESQALKKLETEVQGMKTAQEQNVNKQYEATVAQYSKEIDKVVAENAEFSSVKELKKQSYVLQHILDTFHEDGEILTVEEAAQEVEAQLLVEAEEFHKLTKIQAKLQPVTPTQQKLPPPRSGLRTLSAAASSTTQSDRPPAKQFQYLTMQERIAEARARAQRGQQ